jgi:DNA-3-methyladenine glycosylase
VILGPEFYSRLTLEVAPELVGATLFVEQAGVACSGRIVEVEAYLGQDDPASHAAAGPTPRSAIMFGPPGVAYVYFIYGVHHCLNFVTEQEGSAGAVLVRALEPLAGLEIMSDRRGGVEDRDLCNGPGKLCQALEVDRRWNGVSLDGQGERRIWVEAATGHRPQVERSTRIGINKGVAAPYRFTAAGSRFLSR